MRHHPRGSCPFCKRTTLRLDKAGKLPVHQTSLIVPRSLVGLAARCPGSGRSPAKPPPDGDVSWCALCDDGGAQWNGYAYVHPRCVEEARHQEEARKKRATNSGQSGQSGQSGRFA